MARGDALNLGAGLYPAIDQRQKVADFFNRKPQIPCPHHEPQLRHVAVVIAARDLRGLIKLVADARTDRLLGGVVVAPAGADSIQTLAMALKAGMTAKALGETIFPYLTTVEGLKLAAQTFERDVARLSCCAG